MLFFLDVTTVHVWAFVLNLKIGAILKQAFPIYVACDMLNEIFDKQIIWPFLP